MISQDPDQNHKPLLDALRTRLTEGRLHLQQAWIRQPKPERMLAGLAQLVDEVLIELWHSFPLPPSASLLAVGGYGRGQLYPHSDVDLLILLEEQACRETSHTIEELVRLFWDIGLETGHSVRTLAECKEEAGKDVTVRTNLLEARHLCGNAELSRELIAASRSGFDVKTFFIAKRAEQEQRYNRFNDTPYSLEPNCKESPGGLRDLQNIVWIALAAGHGDNWDAFVQHGLLSSGESLEIHKIERFLQKIRISLHYLAKRREDRLLFDFQEALAQEMGISATDSRRASEVLMQRYYLNAKKVTQFNILLLQSLASRILPGGNPAPTPINERFSKCQGLLDIANDALFSTTPTAIFEAFLLMEQNPELSGMSVRTLRALWSARSLIDQSFRQNPENRRLFIELFKPAHGITHEFRRLNQYGILGRYLPAFGHIVGQMQHDLFHVYTVDQHIMQVMRNMRRFAMDEHAHEYPLCAQLMNGFERPWLLYIAALFHDIAKGRGGDHSKLGMKDAADFCRDHGLSSEDSALIVWLVEHHLTMSQVAQKSDLSDPDVIRKFAQLVGDERHLVALYLLTHCDIRGTSPKVWNGWKAKLIEDLYLITSRVLRGDLPEQVKGITERKTDACSRLRYFGLIEGVETALWEELDTVYFLRHDIDEIVWHARMLYYRPSPETAVIKARPSPIERGLQVMVYARDTARLFLRLCGFFGRMGLSILDAKIHTTRHGYALDSFILFDPSGDENYRDIIPLIEHELTERLQTDAPPARPASGRLSRQLKHFPIIPEVSIRPDEKGQYFILSIAAADRPGLLFAVADILSEHGVDLHTAKISTLGERAEDTFLVSGPCLSATSAIVKLEGALQEALQI
ncbi:[protein-PII] uridylyltransferase [Niveibacterium terrae]|uniref:[protein-PII] uridylyltransferase n=1 Tax=Niveibacterium terrae TaxID=3373598 RepID=UPI003A8F2761